MKKSIVVAIISAVLVIGGATAVFAATDQSKLADVKSLYQQMFSTQQQIIDKEVEAGALTQAQADSIKTQMAERQKYMEQSINNGQFVGPGAGLGCGGMRFGQGAGPGFGPGAGGCGAFGGGRFAPGNATVQN